MEKIIQITEKEYNSLYNKANLTQGEIDLKAKELYEEYGIHKIELTVSTEQYDESIDIQANAYVKDWDSKYPLKEEDKKKIIHFVENKAEQMFRRSFGDVIHSLETLKRKEKKLDTIIRKNLILTVTGWLVAIALLLLGFFIN